MKINYTQAFLKKIETIFWEASYVLRYEKGGFKSGYCIIKEKRMIMVNKFLSLEGKINTLIDLLGDLDFDSGSLTDKSRDLYHRIKQEKEQMHLL